MEINNLIKNIIDISKLAGDAILQHYNFDKIEVEVKGDGSPLTKADTSSNDIITSELEKLTPEIPILSEETYSKESNSFGAPRKFWLVDPLDGTKEFINKNDEFTVNIALISDYRPVLGVVHAPAINTTYYGAMEVGAFKNGSPIKTRKLNREKLSIVASRRHGTEALNSFMVKIEKQFNSHELKNIGSSLKITLVAEGKADFYPRLAPTSKWDTAAAHAILNAAGGLLTDIHFKELEYDPSTDILNPNFYTFGGDLDFWKTFLTEQ